MIIRYLSAIVFLAALFIISPTAFCSQSPKLSLYKTVFYPQDPDYHANKIDVQEYPEAVRKRLIEYQERSKRFHSRIKSPNGSWEEKVIFKKKTYVEQGIVALISTKGIEEAAARFAKDAPLYYEWEGYSEGPLYEAEFAENYLIKYPQTFLKPYILLFLVHRYRVSHECLGYENSYQKQAEVSEKYHKYLNEAKNEKDPLIGLVADDIDKQKYLYLTPEEHP